MEPIDEKLFYRGMALAALIVKGGDTEIGIVQNAFKYADSMMEHKERLRRAKLTPEQLAREQIEAESDIPF